MIYDELFGLVRLFKLQVNLNALKKFSFAGFSTNILGQSNSLIGQIKASFLTNKLFDKGQAIRLLSFLCRSHTHNAFFPSKSIPYKKLYSRNRLRYLITFVIKISSDKEA